MPDECLHSFFLRDAILNAPHKISSKEFWVGADRFTSLRLFTDFTSYFSKKYSDYLSELDFSKLEKNNTLCPLYRPMNKSSILVSEDEICLSFPRPHRNDHKTVDLRICIKCIALQIETHGFFWIKTEWINPHVLFCSIHHTRLTPAAIAYKEIVANAHLPRWIKEKESTLDSISGERISLNNEFYLFGKWFNDLRVGNLPHLSLEQQQKILKKAYLELGYDIDKVKHISNVLSAEVDSLKILMRESSSTFPSILHGNHDARELNGFFSVYPKGMSTTYFWSIVFLAYRDFDKFLRKNATLWYKKPQDSVSN